MLHFLAKQYYLWHSTLPNGIVCWSRYEKKYKEYCYADVNAMTNRPIVVPLSYDPLLFPFWRLDRYGWVSVVIKSLHLFVSHRMMKKKKKWLIFLCWNDCFSSPSNRWRSNHIVNQWTQTIRVYGMRGRKFHTQLWHTGKLHVWRHLV